MEKFLPAVYTNSPLRSMVPATNEVVIRGRWAAREKMNPELGSAWIRLSGGEQMPTRNGGSAGIWWSAYMTWCPSSSFAKSCSSLRIRATIPLRTCLVMALGGHVAQIASLW